MRVWREALCCTRRRGNGVAESPNNSSDHICGSKGGPSTLRSVPLSHFMLGKTSAVDDQGSASNPTGHRACQKQDGVSDVFGCTHSRQRAFGSFSHELLYISAKLCALAAQHRRVDIAGTHAIHTDVVLAVVDCHGTGQVHGSAFGGAVGRSLRSSFQ